MKKIYSLFIAISLIIISCGSIKTTLKNVDDTALKPQIKNNQFIVTEYSNDKKYGYNKDYPINIGFDNEKIAPKNVDYYFNALTGKKGEKIKYKKFETCCPFPTKRTKIGAGTLDIYEVTIDGNPKPIYLYFNIYEKGKILCPDGFTIKPL